MKINSKQSLVVVVLAVSIAGFVLYVRQKPNAESDERKVSVAQAGVSPPKASSPADSSAGRPRESIGATQSKLGPHVINVDVSVPESQTGARIRTIEAELKNGDPKNAYELFALLERCNKAASNVDALLALRLQGKPIDTAYLEQQKTVVAACREITQEQRARASHVLDIAAAAGDVRAQTLYVNHPPPELQSADGLVKYPEKVAEFKSKAINYLHAASNAGSVLAMANLAGAYRDGILVPQDRIAAYAYYLASTSLTSGQQTPEVTKSYESGLSGADLQRAHELHKQILARARK